MKKPVTSFVQSIENLAKLGARFASLLYSAKGTGEIAKHRVILGINIENAYRRDVVILGKESVAISEKWIAESLAGKVSVSADAAIEACGELLASLRESLTLGVGNNSGYTCKGVYRSFCNGVKLHIEKSELHVTGFSIGKTVIVPGEYKSVKSSPKTLAKNALKKVMKSGRFRQFAVSELESVAMNGKTFVFE